MTTHPQLFRVFPLTGEEFEIRIDEVPTKVRAGQSVLSALLERGKVLRHHETNCEPRAGFCLMGACQDCWVWLSPEQRGRSCTATVEPGMQIFTKIPPGQSFA